MRKRGLTVYFYEWMHYGRFQKDMSTFWNQYSYIDLDVKFRIKIHIQYCIYQWKVQYQAHVQYSKEVFSIISVDKKLVPILLEEMKWPPAGNFKSHSKYLLKFEEAVFLIFNEDTMDFKKLVNYISEFVLQVRVLPYLQ